MADEKEKQTWSIIDPISPEMDQRLLTTKNGRPSNTAPLTDAADYDLRWRDFVGPNPPDKADMLQFWKCLEACAAI